MDCTVYSVSTYPLDGDLSGGYPPLKWLSLEFRSDCSNWGLQEIQHSTKSELQVDLVVSFVFSQVIATKFSLTNQNSFSLIPSFFILNNNILHQWGTIVWSNNPQDEFGGILFTGPEDSMTIQSLKLLLEKNFCPWFHLSPSWKYWEIIHHPVWKLVLLNPGHQCCKG